VTPGGGAKNSGGGGTSSTPTSISLTAASPSESIYKRIVPEVPVELLQDTFF